MCLTGQDGNGKVVTLALKLCPQDSEEQRQAFSQALKELVIDSESGRTLREWLEAATHTAITDRQKSLRLAAREQVLAAQRARAMTEMQVRRGAPLTPPTHAALRCVRRQPRLQRWCRL